MVYIRNKSLRGETHTWPGFVDALAALLMVVIFVLMIFSLAQFYLNQVVNVKDDALFDLNNQISEIYKLLKIEKDTNKELSSNLNAIEVKLIESKKGYINIKEENDALSETIISLKKDLIIKDEQNRKLNDLYFSLSKKNTQDIKEFEKSIEDFNKTIIVDRDTIAVQLNDIIQLKSIKEELQLQVVELISNDKEINANLLQERDYSKTLEEKITSLKDKSILAQKEVTKNSAESIKMKSKIKNLKITLSQLNLKLSQLQALFEKQKVEDLKNNIELETFGNNLNNALANRLLELQKFRSEFFGRLSELLENREEIQIVGDRFVFQSEVLFEQGSASIGIDGEDQLKKLTITLKEIAKTIPEDINWVLQVEGHTDTVPIKAGKFLDNWDLSTERALSVVRFLIEEGINPKRVSATGYGEHQPLPIIDEEENNIDNFRKNRRIELKITQRI